MNEQTRMAAPRGVPLSRNRNFHLLWLAQTGSELTNQVFTLVYPLLALWTLGSPALAGLVGTALVGAQLVAGLPAGVFADRWNRKAILVACAALRTLAYLSVALALHWDGLTLPHLLVAAVVEGAALAATFPAEEAALPQVVGQDQLATALALNNARVSAGQVLGNTLGGVLIGLSRTLPFVLNAALGLLSTIALLFVRIPRSRPGPDSGPAEPAAFWRNMAAGVRWVVAQPVIRLTSSCAVVLNLVLSAVLLIVIIRAEQQGTSAWMIGVMVSMLGVGGILGALASAPLHRVLTPYVSITGVVWVSTLLLPVLALVTSPVASGALLAVAAFVSPLANTTISTYQLLLTPDAMRGRLSGAMGMLDGIAGALGPAMAGILTQLYGARGALFVCAALSVVPALIAALSPTLRRFSGVPPTDIAGPTIEETSR